MKKIIFILILGIFVSLIIFFSFQYYNTNNDHTINDTNIINNTKNKTINTINNQTLNQSRSNQACLDLGCSSNTKYVGSKNSDKYYGCECGWGKNIKKENLLCFESAGEAENLNYTRSYC